MNENEQNRNQIALDGRVHATHEYVDLYLYPWNDSRINYYMHALVISALIFENTGQSFARMVNLLNNRLEHPLTIEEQDYAYELLQHGIREGLL